MNFNFVGSKVKQFVSSAQDNIKNLQQQVAQAVAIMGNDFESPSKSLWDESDEQYGYKPKKAKSIVALLEDIEKLNKISKNQLATVRFIYYILPHSLVATLLSCCNKIS